MNAAAPFSCKTYCHFNFMSSSQFLRAIAECFARLGHGLGICRSVRLSATLLYCVKKVQASITKFLPRAASMSSFSRQNFMPLGEGVPLERERQKGVPLKRRYFAVIGSYSVKTVANRYRHAAYHNRHW